MILFSSATVFAAQNPTTIKRLLGENRYGTSAAVALSKWTQSDYVILAFGEDFPDALSAAPLAKKYNAPILLTETNSIPAETLSAINQLKAKNIIIIGGTGVISSAVEKQLSSLGTTVTRIFGQDRYETGIKIAEQLDNVTEIAIVTGENFADALSISPIAAKENMPIILVPHNAIPSVVTAYINNHKLTKTYVIGSGTSLNNTVLTGLSNTELITGNDKYQINLNIIDKFKNDLDLSTVYLATGENFADALSGSVLAGINSNPLLLIGNDPSSEKDYFANNSISIANIDILGGIGAVTDDVVNKFSEANPIASDPNSSSSSILSSNIYLSVGEIDFLSTKLTKTTANKATFKYKILDKAGKDITATVPANEFMRNFWINSAGGSIILDPLTGTGTIPYDFADTDQFVTVQLVCSNGISKTSTLSLGDAKAEDVLVVSDINLVSNKLTKTGANITTFQYKVQNKYNIDITKKIPATQIDAVTSVNSTVTLDPSTATGTITYNSSTDVNKPINISLKDKLTGITVSSAVFTPEAATESPKISKIDITSTKLAIDHTSETGYSTYKIYDQYGYDITNTPLGAGVKFISEVGTTTASNGLITVRISPNASVNFSTLNSLLITGSDSTTGISTSATLIIQH